MMIGMSILAIVNLGQMAAQGNAMMAADQAKNAAEAASSGAQEAAKGAAGAEGYSVGVGDSFKTPDGVELKITNMGNALEMKAGTVEFKLPDGSVGKTTINSRFFERCNSNDDVKKLMMNLGKAILKQKLGLSADPGDEI